MKAIHIVGLILLGMGTILLCFGVAIFSWGSNIPADPGYDPQWFPIFLIAMLPAVSMNLIGCIFLLVDSSWKRKATLILIISRLSFYIITPIALIVSVRANNGVVAIFAYICAVAVSVATMIMFIRDAVRYG